MLPLTSRPDDADTANATSCGITFINWLRQAIRENEIAFNNAGALMYTLTDTVFLVSPGISQRYAQEYSRLSTTSPGSPQREWQQVQKEFERLQIHRKRPDGLNIWTCMISGAKQPRRLNGYLLNEPEILLDTHISSYSQISLIDAP
ncbi:conjugal transfer nickase/helicase domain-containing protein [Enterobacter hormaechei subsp. steigerwaltii]|uniref:conjugal transfer nickase/helicase domain-containing protein n=1 Tax=Enterobacter hormaechei TaxID=158836 RepID=UPI001BE02B91|nr:DNA-binding domain-containing protein [Enterobacter hormaechei subsp. xiangfangensis]HAV1851672.1 DNA-binding domain-containing protein [Enterobacter hormaechei subsp. xiangfangensis]